MQREVNEELEYHGEPHNRPKPGPSSILFSCASRHGTVTTLYHVLTFPPLKLALLWQVPIPSLLFSKGKGGKAAINTNTRFQKNTRHGD